MLRTLAVIALSATPALAQAPPSCVARDKMVSYISGAMYDERQVSTGMNGRVIIEFWANVETGTWTVIATRADGKSCLVSSGTNWEISLVGDLV